MKINPSILVLATATLAGLSSVTEVAFAQDAPAETPVDAPPATAEGDSPTTAVAAESTQEGVSVGVAETTAPPPDEAAMPAAEPSPPSDGAVYTEEVVEEAPEAAEPAEDGPGGASISVFADAWMGWQTSKSGSSQCCAASGAAYALNGPTGTQESGFGLNWLGMDLGYDQKYWAVHSSIRMGDAVPLYNVGSLGNRSGFGVTNAYGTLKPTDDLSIDLGAFGTIFGAEVAESWNNLNYTRGELYYNMQPFWHTGLRAEYAPGDFILRGMVVNDPNTSNLGRGAINLALQTGYDNGTFGFLAGALQSTNPGATLRNFNSTTDPDAHVSSNFVIDTFIDSVLILNLDKFSLLGNFDINLGTHQDTPKFWGGSLAAAYHFVPAFGVALRGEYLSTPDGFLYGTAPDAKETLATGTLTFDVKPIPDSENVVLRWDNRIQVANKDAYANSKGDGMEKTWFGSVLGAVFYADLL